MVITGLDFETWGSRPLPKTGQSKYFADPLFRPLIAATASSTRAGGQTEEVYDFVLNDQDRQRFNATMYNYKILEDPDHILAAHNSGFEEGVLRTMGLDNFVHDTAVLTRIMGGSSRLVHAADQFLDFGKMEEGVHLMKLFSMSDEPPTREFVQDHLEEWETYKEYCLVDARASLQLAKTWHSLLTDTDEGHYSKLTRDMNRRGWPVDVALVKEMQARYLTNCDTLIAEFRAKHDPLEFDVKTRKDGTLELVDRPQLNFDSPAQLKQWCLERGIRAKSFDEMAVADMLSTIRARLDKMGFSDPKYQGYHEVVQMLELKQELGGSSLSKLPKILEMVGDDGRLRDQYLHCGAGQTHRTSGTGVQMQNLKRLTDKRDVTELFDPDTFWDNTAMSNNIRQVFTASNPNGKLIVGDLASIESRGLAYLAGQHDKLDEYAKGRDLYRVLGAKMAGLTYDEVPKESPWRTSGKVGELSCGYNAGPSAVQSFAKKMGIPLTEEEAGEIVTGWREANPMIVAWWSDLQKILEAVVDDNYLAATTMHNGIQIRAQRAWTPMSLRKHHPGCVSVVVSILHEGETFTTRILQGLYRRGRDLVYHKPKETRGGPVWTDTFINQKTKRPDFYRIYGGKLAGILTQSFCRELFFRGMSRLERELPYGAELIGQFHDELVVDWDPSRCQVPLEDVSEIMYQAMVGETKFVGFPFEAEVKHDYRYTK